MLGKIFHSFVPGDFRIYIVCRLAAWYNKIRFCKLKIYIFWVINLIELQKIQFKKVGEFLKHNICDTVSAYSILENRQRGRIFVDNLESPKSVLFWHYCGFAILSGDSTNAAFNNEIYKLLLGQFEYRQKRFALVVDNKDWNERIFELVENDTRINKSNRLKFKFDISCFTKTDFTFPAKYNLKTIDDFLLSKMQGTIIPSYSWDSSASFVKEGKGFCLLDGDSIVCAAFSSFIGNNQMDIGVETTEDYRRKGFGAIVASSMVTYALENGFEPVWGCTYGNIGSKGIAQKLGFKIVAVHPFYMKVNEV